MCCRIEETLQLKNVMDKDRIHIAGKIINPDAS